MNIKQNWVNNICYKEYPSKILSYRSSHQEVFLRKGVLKICSKFTGEHPYQSVISIKLLCNFIKIALLHGCSPVYLLHIFRTSFLKKTSGRLLLKLPLLGYEWQTYSGSNISILCVRVCFSANSLGILIVGI